MDEDYRILVVDTGQLSKVLKVKKVFIQNPNTRKWGDRSWMWNVGSRIVGGKSRSSEEKDMEQELDRMELCKFAFQKYF